VTIQEYHRLSREFRQKVVPLVRAMMSYGKTSLTNSARDNLKQVLGLSKQDSLPKELFTLEPVSIEIQDTLDVNQLLLLVTLIIPKVVEGKLSESPEGSKLFKCVVRVLPDTILIVSAAEFHPFKKTVLTSLILEKRSQTQKCNSNKDMSPGLVTLLAGVAAFVRTKRIEEKAAVSKTQENTVEASTKETKEFEAHA